MRFHVGGQIVQRGVHTRAVTFACAGDPKTGHEIRAEPVAAEHAVQITAPDAAGWISGPFGSVPDIQPSIGAVRAIRHALVDFISLQRCPRGAEGGIGQRQVFVCAHGGFHVQVPQAIHAARRPFDPVRIGDGFPQHLIPAANPQDMAAAPHVGCQINIPTLGLEMGQVVDGGFAARQDHQRCVAGQGAALFDDVYRNAGFGHQWVQIVEVGNAAQARHGDFHIAPGSGGNVQDIFRRQPPGIGEPGQDARVKPPRLVHNFQCAIGKQRGITAKLVDGKPFDAGAIIWGQDHMGAHHLGNDTAPVNVAHQNHGHPCGFGKAHVGNVTGAQVHLGRAAGPFHQHQVHATGQAVKTFQHARHQSGFQF